MTAPVRIVGTMGKMGAMEGSYGSYGIILITLIAPILPIISITPIILIIPIALIGPHCPLLHSLSGDKKKGWARRGASTFFFEIIVFIS